ncbi:hypothetical protein KXD40_007891 [Peronospora effusa]|nr:hypothetical protein KXD40_007891 [Peronospora effusa]
MGTGSNGPVKSCGLPPTESHAELPAKTRAARKIPPFDLAPTMADYPEWRHFAGSAEGPSLSIVALDCSSEVLPQHKQVLPLEDACSKR